MNRLTILVIFMCICSQALGQNVYYSVLEVSKGVTFQTDLSSTPMALKASMKVEPAYYINLKKGDRIVVVNDNTGVFSEHSSIQDEQITISKIIKLDSQSFIRSFLSYLFSSNKDNGAYYNQRGGITRGDEDNLPIAQKLVSDWDPNDTRKRPKVSDELIMVLHRVGKKAFFPEIVNNTSDSLFVNILCLNGANSTRDIVFSFLDEKGELLLKIMPHDRIILDGLLLDNKKGKKYILFGTTSCFSSTSLKKELQTGVYSTANTGQEVRIVYGSSRTANN